MKMLKLIQIIIILITIIGCNSSPTTTNSKKSQESPYVILISIDGLRHDYIDKWNPPTLKFLKNNGLSSKSLEPIFPSKTFPNHYSIVTGLYAQGHGLISNSFYDPLIERTYSLGNSTEVSKGEWYLGEPLWVSAHKNKMVSASYFWVGSEAPIQNIRPDHYFKYDGNVPGETRIDQVIEWLKMDKNVRPHFITVYFSEVDHMGHKFGPNSLEVKNALFNVDDYINRLVVKLSTIDLPVNIVLVSDHGMTEIYNDKKIILPQEVKQNKEINIVGKGSLSLIYKINDKVDLNKTYQKLKRIKNLNVYLKHEIPNRFYYKDNIRIPDILLTPDQPYYISTKENIVSGGTHGYDPSNIDMHGVFFAYGPNIKPAQIPSFKNIHIYPFITKILGINGNKNIDGNEKVLGSYVK